ncbi:hypothetical protein PARPLA_00548 [Rhodobacteraceae bacterium THAF1]|uniref:FkbM family methyltransferase n=1 Tax=Palleronia sp. THAF1 TaxID=2587842 RepID=UPI000F3E2F23|nr:FkbM family methyltransferase [Palleronia sp. THAF1]QFU09889.1 hypothetical protein FIU81_14520 [Palleronia sp. THAF1]VDC17208.1 hypothetical protein PARPLA_00548 [Rhodobacteraceae bacterium THAF1]
MRVRIFKDLEKTLPEDRFVAWTNLRGRYRGKQHYVSSVPSEPEGILIAQDKFDRIYFCRRPRHNRYKNGIMNRVDFLAHEYHLDRLTDLRGGTFIDCGANVGELGLWAKVRGFSYIPFEPEDLEARCVDLNVFDGADTCHRKGLWNETTTLQFHSSPDSADSSLIAFEGSTQTAKLEVVRLDDAVDLSTADGPVIFKLEAEGAEPEVLEGAKDSLAHIDWVAVDCGYERGPDKQHTFVETNTALVDHGFRLVAAQFGRVTALYGRPGAT